VQKACRWISTRLKSIFLRARSLCFLIHSLFIFIGFGFYEWVWWIKRDFGDPSPAIIKRLLLRRIGGRGIWIESGTFKGETTEFLSSFSKMVYSIEPSSELFARAVNKFSKFTNVEIIHGLSEDCLSGVQNKLTSEQVKDVSFWLDGHYSEGITFRGPSDTPILAELEIISSNIRRFTQVSVFVDDVRCFDPSQRIYASYPSKDELVYWANRHNLNWMIEHDIFIAKNY